MALYDLAITAKSVVIGTVVSVGPGPVGTIKSLGRVAPVRVQLRVTSVLKGAVTVSSLVTLLQDPYVKSPVTAGERVLWFLGERAADGSLSPIGVFSGHFRLQGSDAGGWFAQNLFGNAGLWDTQSPLWPDSKARVALETDLSRTNISSDRKSAILKYAADGCLPRPIPLDLIAAVVRSSS